MKIRTLEQLIDAVDADFSWRKKELAVLLSLLQGSQGPTAGALQRCAIPILYAHWEGYIKHSACSYLEYVGRKQMPRSELSASFAAWAIRSELRRVNSQRVSSLVSIVNLLVDRSEEPSQLPWKTGVETYGNLTSEVLQEIVLSLGLDYSPYESKENLIDGTLVHYRNHIAHGRGMTLEFARYHELHKEVIGLMEIFRTQIENAALLRGYARPEVNPSDQPMQR